MNAQLKVKESPAETPAASVASPAEEDRRFSPRAKHPVLEMTVRCQTEAVEKILEVNFDPVQKALYHIHVTLPIMSRASPKVINEVLDLVEHRFGKIEQQMDLELGRLKALAKTDGAVQPSEYTNPSEQVIQVFTPEMARWIGMLMRMDEILRWVDALWYSTRVKSKDRSALLMQWRNTMTGFSRELHNLHLRAQSSYDSEHAAGAAAPRNIGYIKDAVRAVKAARKAGTGGEATSIKAPKAPKEPKPASAAKSPKAVRAAGEGAPVPASEAAARAEAPGSGAAEAMAEQAATA